ncbi:MAG: glycosyltransferase family 39 protein [Candidatus Curtissbacteria bacterium]|nr:glycosyltransferase family 39 protein [Candidatus Curtissbacteria bacterium]
MKSKTILFTILALAFALRFFQLGQVPPSLNWDENSNAYNAYSILKTGRDEYGNFLPLANRSFDDYKPPLYMYLSVPSIAIFGLTPFAARLPSAVFGFLTVPLVYLLARKLFQNSSNKETIALIAALLLSIAPWHLHFSRIGLEANIGLFLTVAAVTTFLYGITNKKLLILSAVLFVLSLYAYHAQRATTPLLLLTLVVIFKNEIRNFPKKYKAAFVAIILTGVAILIILAPRETFTGRLQQAGSEARREDIEKSIKYLEYDNLSPFSKIVHNRRVTIAQTALNNYLQSFDLNFLFTRGDDNSRHHVDGIGMLYLFQLPLALIGIFLLVKHKNKEALLILAWLLIAPIPVALARPSPHAIRSFSMVIPLTIICALALSVLIQQKGKYRIIAQGVTIIAVASSLFIYLHEYFYHYPITHAFSWQYGYAQAAVESNKLKNDFDKVIVDKSIEQAYVFWLFNTKYDPKNFQENGNANSFDKFYFSDQAPTNPRELFVSASDLPEGFKTVALINLPNGEKSIKIGYKEK